MRARAPLFALPKKGRRTEARGRSARGSSSLEYTVLAGCIAVAVIGSVATAIGPALRPYDTIATALVPVLLDDALWNAASSTPVASSAFVAVQPVPEGPAAAPPPENRSGLGDGTNPGRGQGRGNSPNAGTDNPGRGNP